MGPIERMQVLNVANSLSFDRGNVIENANSIILWVGDGENWLVRWNAVQLASRTIGRKKLQPLLAAAEKYANYAIVPKAKKSPAKVPRVKGKPARTPPKGNRS